MVLLRPSLLLVASQQVLATLAATVSTSRFREAVKRLRLTFQKGTKAETAALKRAGAINPNGATAPALVNMHTLKKVLHKLGLLTGDMGQQLDQAQGLLAPHVGLQMEMEGPPVQVGMWG